MCMHVYLYVHVFAHVYICVQAGIWYLGVDIIVHCLYFVFCS